MTVLTVNEALQVLLTGANGPAEIRDMSGQLLGYFTPPGREEDLLYQQAEKLFDPVEFVRLKREEHGKGLSFDQVIAHLKSLEKPQPY